MNMQDMNFGPEWLWYLIIFSGIIAIIYTIVKVVLWIIHHIQIV